MAWTCSKCTFINSPSQKFNCQICLSELPPSSISLSPSSSSPSKPKWSCNACTFLNLYSKTSCEICGTRASSSASLLSTLEDDELELVDSSVGNVFLPLQRCNKRKNGDGAVGFGDDVDKIGDKSSKRKDPFGVSENATDFGGCLGDKSAKRVHHLGVCENATESGGFLGDKSTERKEPFGVCGNFTESGGSPGVKSAKNAVVPSVLVTEENQSATDSSTLRIMSYNVWFREDLEMHKRMKSLGDLIQLHCPDVICFQEVTPSIYDIFQQSSWWKIYCCSVSNEMAFTRPYFCMQLSKLPVKSYCCKPFSNSIMGRELCVAEVKVQTEIPLVVATSHLESPCPAPPKWDQMFSKERVDQAKEALNFLETNPNVIFCGDMNWDDRLDGNFPLPDGWTDAWTELKPRENGWTYDTKSNKMLTGNRTLQKRLDRFLCSLRDFKVNGIDMIGMEAIPGLQYCKEKKVKTEVRKLMLPVLPSDHYGLLLTLSPQ